MTAMSVAISQAFSLARSVAEVGGGFNPISLFAANEPGYIYDNNDLTSFYSDSAMTTQAVVNGPVGAQRDKSPNAKHRTQATAASRPTLRGTPTGANLFTAYGTPGAGWVNSGGGVATATASNAAMPTTTAAVIGRVYRVTYTMTVTGGTLTPSFGGVSLTARTAAGTYEQYITASSVAVLTFTGTAFTGTVSAINARDVSADAVTAPYGLQYDGVDDFMVTASVNFTATDALTLCMGVRKLSDVSQGTIFELSASSAVNNGVFAIFGPSFASGNNYGIWSKGTTLAATASGGGISPNTSVITGIGDISSPFVRSRVNGVQAENVTSSQGTGNYGNYPIYFGRRGGASLPFNGLDFGGVCIGRTLSAADLTSTERWTGQRTGVTI